MSDIETHPLPPFLPPNAKLLILEKFVNQQVNMEWIEYDIEKYRAMNLQMAADGFHPSKEVYTLWGQEVAGKIRKTF